MRITTMATIAVLSLGPQAAICQERPTYFRQLEKTVYLPVSNTNTSIISVHVPPGNWIISAGVNAKNEGDDYNPIFCDIILNGVGVSGSTVSMGMSAGNVFLMRFPLQAAVQAERQSNKVELGCRQNDTGTHDTVLGGFTTMLVTPTGPLK